ncbi:hypothetical protein [Baekduia sp.]|jgi:hypothetical protein|uniref:hypothetical protein n=1 Tax=Baekduia sp. TaxID=2600305 RepID=UPI002DFBBDC1|nr:hypothetical protein [Baekduia sp.]
MLRTPVSCAVLLALVVLALVAPAATWADTPSAATADTLGVTAITGTTATFQATLNPHGLPTIAHIEYGITEDLLQSTPDVAVGSGATAIPFTVPVTALVAGRHYFAAVYVSNSAGGEYGDMVEFDTPRVPRLGPAAETDITQFSATLHVRVLGYGVPVTLTASTVSLGGVVLPSGPLTVTADGDAALPVAGLQPSTAYRWSVTGTSAGGADVTRGTFRTLPLVAMPRPAISANSVAYGSRVTVTGTIPLAPGLAVALQQQPFPFVAPFAAVPGAAGATDAQGAYTFTVQALGSAKYGVSAVGYQAPGPANTVQVRVFASVAAHAKRARRHRFVVSGRYWPDVPSKASLYRLRHGRVGFSVTPASSGGNSRTFRFGARKLKPGSYEIRLTMARSTGVDSTRSASFRIPRR